MLLDHWLLAVDSLQEGEVAFLPYDFSDQYTGALKVQRRGFQLMIETCWSPVYFCLYPSFISECQMKEEEFRTTSSPCTLPLAYFLEEIRRERDKIG